MASSASKETASTSLVPMSKKENDQKENNSPLDVVKLLMKWEEVLPDIFPLVISKNIIWPYLGFAVLDIRKVPENLNLTVSSNQTTLSVWNQRIHRFNLFDINIPFDDLATVGENLAFANPEKVREILEKNKNPTLRTTKIEVVDHRPVGTIPPLTPFQLSLYLKDVLIRDKKNETMAGMLRRDLLETCGEQELLKQQEELHQLIKKEEQERLTKRPVDSNALTTVFGVLDEHDAKDAKVSDAIGAYRNILGASNDDEIIVKALELSDEKFVHFGGYNTPKNNVFVNQIIGTAQWLRLSIAQLQALYGGELYDFLYHNGQPGKLEKRFDVVKELGLDIPTSDYSRVDNSKWILSFNCHLEICRGHGVAPVAGCWRVADLETFFRATTSALENLCNIQTINRLPDVRSSSK